jgi:RNA polymerase sigma-70 factor (ECF subfamily)
MNDLFNAFDIETELIKDAQRGDLEAFNLLIPAYQDLLFGIALRLLNDEDAAADAVQEALISAFRKLNTFRGASLRGWLARIVVNACYDEIRKKRRTNSIPLGRLDAEDNEIETSYWFADPQASPEKQYESRELEAVIQQRLNTLPHIYRVALVLVDVEGLSYEEAATALNVPIGTIKSRLARARVRMQRLLRNTGEILPASYRERLPLSV